MKRRAAVLGHPIGHSLSPVLHRAAYRALELDWSYDAIDVTEASLPGFLAGLGPEWAGLSLTMPLKQAVLPLLDSVAPLVHEAGGANTVLLRHGRRHGDNTDVAGIVRAVEEAAGFASPLSVGIVGAGATAVAASAACRAWSPRQVSIVARRRPAAEAVAAHARSLGLDAAAGEWADPAGTFAADLLIVTLPGDAAAPLARFVPARPGLLLDVSYHPWPSVLAAAWRQAGGLSVGGHRMLLWQAARQVELMTGQPAPTDAMDRALERELRVQSGGIA